ncbi:MAG: hypothetical protein ACK5Z2_17330 [Bacteroidota bacterium]|jgi:acetoin utilization deacetylase AcuC-like enzyme
MRYSKICSFYHEQLSPAQLRGHNASLTPRKPKMLMAYLRRMQLDRHFELKQNFKPFTREAFYIAHTRSYVDGFFSGEKKHTRGSNLQWSPDFLKSVQYTNAALYEAVKWAVQHPQQITFAPVGGFHHAQPAQGLGYCTFSGQVITAVKLFRESGLRGAFVDLDGHFGNSIEDSRSFVPDLNRAIHPEFGNINPQGKHSQWINDFRRQLGLLRDAIQHNEVDYIVFCHGADSHEHDDTRGQCTTAEWLECAQIFYDFIARIDRKRNTPMPLALCLFGGYRKDDFDSVLSLHTADLVCCLNTLCGQEIVFEAKVKKQEFRR